jgi:thiol-disulfide isomerase/thioredoxin
VKQALGAALVLAALAACRPAESLTLLFLDRSPAAALGGLSWAPQPDSSRLIGFDASLRPVKTFTSSELATPVAVAALSSHLLVSERTGEAVVFDTTGRVVREWEGPDPADLYATTGDHVATARSPYLVQFVPEPDTAPLLRVLDTLGRPVGRVGTVRVPVIQLLGQLANAGAVTGDRSGAIYFAPLVRDEIVKYDGTGALRWTATRELFAKETDPVLQASPAHAGTIAARYAIVSIAAVIGPDGRLYVLGASDSSGTRLRLDVLDTATGKIVLTRALGARQTAIAVSRDGVIVTLDADTLLAGLANRGVARPPFEPPFALPDLHGDTLRLSAFHGKVTLVNFWASWCEPCREEFPHMAELYREFPRRDFDIAAISDDVDRGRMARFVTEFRPPFPILVGGGRMKAVYHYRGLPYSLLLDARGRIVQRIFGFGGSDEFAALRQTIANEIRKP